MSEYFVQPLGWSWLAAALGLIFGSFLNVCISRLPDDYSVVAPRSHCPACGAWIAWYDNIPLLSYLLLAGKCRECRAGISWRYPAVEALTASLFYFAFVIHGPGWAAVKWSVFGAWLVALIFTDLETRILPDEFTKSGIVLGILLAPIAPIPPGLIAMIAAYQPGPFSSLLDASFTAAALPGGIWLLGLAYQKIRGVEGLGFGDVKMLSFLGAFLGLESTMVVLILASLMGAVLGLIWIKLRGEDSSKYELPFGSFLGFAGLLVAFAGAKLFSALPY